MTNFKMVFFVYRYETRNLFYRTVFRAKKQLLVYLENNHKNNFQLEKISRYTVLIIFIAFILGLITQITFRNQIKYILCLKS